MADHTHTWWHDITALRCTSGGLRPGLTLWMWSIVIPTVDSLDQRTEYHMDGTNCYVQALYLMVKIRLYIYKYICKKGFSFYDVIQRCALCMLSIQALSNPAKLSNHIIQSSSFTQLLYCLILLNYLTLLDSILVIHSCYTI